MSLTVFAVVLFAAALHATWNAIVAGAADKVMTTVLVGGSAAAVALVAVPFVPPPAPASWPFILASGVIHVAYHALLANAYRTGDLSRMYPLMRGAAPLIVTVASALVLSETLTVLGWSGVALISFGILSLAFGGSRGTPGTAGTGFALANAVVIASYTLVDGAGVRLSGSPAGYTVWLIVLNGVPLIGWALVARRAAFFALVRTKLHLGLIGGLGTLVSYGLALWAMTLAPIPLVAALRETSILFGTAIAGFILREHITPVRLAAVALVAAGAIVLRLA